MKVFVWEESQIGGGFSCVVAAPDLETAINVLKNNDDLGSGVADWLRKQEPKIVEIENPTLITYFEYYE